MKKVLLVLFGIVLLVGCTKFDEYPLPPVNTNETLKIDAASGLKLQSVFVTSEVAINVKLEAGQNVTIKIFDIANRVVSKETMYANTGDNILKVYTNAFPASAYRIALYGADGKMIGITDFNKL
jgi:PBP1b-binding outer membrane lipoprotein LpoB